MPSSPVLYAKRFCRALLLPALCAASPFAAAATLYVKADANGANNGSSWTNAYTDLQAALAAAASGDEIWVAAGIYKPTATTDRNISFSLRNGVAVYGGFAGTESLLAERDTAAHPTILSGDIGTVGDNSDNSYHVFFHAGSNIDASAVLDGFTVTGGNAGRSFTNSAGGGMKNGLYATDEFRATLRNLIFSDNSAIWGGGMYCTGVCAPSLANIVFRNNHAGLSFDTFTLGGGGGLMHVGVGSSGPILTNVTFSGNSSDGSGGAIYVAGGQGFIVNNSILWGNAAADGTQIFLGDGSIALNNSIVEGGCPGGVICNNVLADDPLFVNAAGGDLHLQNGSPAIDVGDNAALPADVATDLDGRPRIFNDTVDLGPYENQPAPAPMHGSLAGEPLRLGLLLGLLGLAALRRRPPQARRG